MATLKGEERHYFIDQEELHRFFVQHNTICDSYLDIHEKIIQLCILADSYMEEKYDLNFIISSMIHILDALYIHSLEIYNYIENDILPVSDLLNDEKQSV